MNFFKVMDEDFESSQRNSNDSPYFLLIKTILQKSVGMIRSFSLVIRSGHLTARKNSCIRMLTVFKCT